MLPYLDSHENPILSICNDKESEMEDHYIATMVFIEQEYTFRIESYEQNCDCDHFF